MRKGCMGCYFQTNSQRQKTLEGIVLTYYFALFGSSLVISHILLENKDLTGRIQALEFTNETHQQVIEEKDAAIALLNDDLKNREDENVGLQDKIRAKDQQIAALKRRYVGYLSDEDKNNEKSIIAKNNEEAEYPLLSICGQHGYRRHKVRVLLTLQ